MKKNRTNTILHYFLKGQLDDILVVILPGLMSNAHRDIVLPLEKSVHKYDIVTLSLYDGETGLYRDIDKITSEVNNLLKKYKKYKNIYLIGYSFGSSVLMLSGITSIAKHIFFWSPTPWVPQGISKTLETITPRLYGVDGCVINKKLAHQLDTLDIHTLVKSLTNKEVTIFFSIGDDKKIWKDVLTNNSKPKKVHYFSMPYPHQYTGIQKRRLYSMVEKIINKDISKQNSQLARGSNKKSTK